MQDKQLKPHTHTLSLFGGWEGEREQKYKSKKNQ